MLDFGYGVRLGPIEAKHQEKLRGWRNDPRIYRWCRQNDLIQETHQEAWYQKQASDPTCFMYAVHWTQEEKDQVVGVCGLTSLDSWNQRAEFSLYIGPEFQGQKLGTMALQTLLHHGFMGQGLHLIWGETFEKNPAMGMFVGLGFHWDGVRRQFYYKNGRFIDAHLVSVTRPEFEKLPWVNLPEGTPELSDEVDRYLWEKEAA